MDRERVLIVESDESLANSIAKALAVQGILPRITGSALAALGALSQEGLRLLILGDESTGMDAIELCGLFHADPRAASLPLVVISTRRAEQDRVAAFHSGATDFVAKPLSVRELSLRVRAILRRQTACAVESSCLRVGEIEILVEQHLVRVEGQSLQLTRQELRLLSAMAKQCGRAFTRSELLDVVWGGAADVMERTVDAHIKGLRAKLGSAASQIETVHGVGYRLSEQGRKTTHQENGKQC